MKIPPLSPAVLADSQIIRSDLSSSLLYCSHISDPASAATLTQTSIRHVTGRVKGEDVGCLKVGLLNVKVQLLEVGKLTDTVPLIKWLGLSLSPGQVPNYLHLNSGQLNSSSKSYNI